MTRIQLKSISILLWLCVSVAYAGLPEAKLKIELKKPDDAAGITSSANAAMVTLTSKRGIGGAKLIRTGDAWPARLTIHLSVKGLESLVIENGTIRADTSLKEAKNSPYWKVGENGQLGAAPDGNLTISMAQSAEAVEIVIPREMLAGNPAWIRLAWIDFFRG